MPVAQLRLCSVLLPASLALTVPLLAADIDAPKASGSAGNPTFRPLVADDRPTQPTLAPASNEGQVRIQQFRHVPGLKIDLWAAEPLLANPVAFSVDERGRVFTSETYRYRTSVLDIRHYMFMLEDDLAARTLEDRLAMIRKWFGPEGEQALSRETEVIRQLEDTNRDGRADVSRILADGFSSPLDGIASGVLARNGEVWFTDIPSVWKLSPAPAGKDITPPPRTPLASQPKVHQPGWQAEEVFRGFGVRFSFTGHDLHGLKLGPDGRLYFSLGDRGAHLTTREGVVIDLPDEGAVFRCELDGSRLEVVHRGLRNPQELAFNDLGDLFTGDNDSDQGDRERWVEVIEGADSGWRVGHQHAPLGQAGLWNLERLWVPHFDGQAAYLMPPIANIGDGPSGLVYDYGTSLPEPLAHRFLLAYFKGTSARSGLYSLAVRPAGGSYELVAHDEFVWNSLVPDVDLGPDGSIYFADWHEGWPKSNKGRLYRSVFPEVAADPVTRETAQLLADGFRTRSESELLRLLGHRDQRVRLESQYELANRGGASWTGLKTTALSPGSTQARVHALWALSQIVRLSEPPLQAPTSKWITELEALLPLLKDPDPEIRAQAARLFGDAQWVGASDPLAELVLAETSARVRRFAGLALAKAAYGWRRGPARTPAPAESGTAGGQAVQGADGNAWPIFVRILEQAPAEDRSLRHAATVGLRYALRPPNGSATSPANPMIVERLRSHPQPQVRLALAVALRQLEDPALAWLAADPHPLVALETARAIHDVPVPQAFPELTRLAEPARLDLLLTQFATMQRGTEPTPRPGAIRDVRADQPLPWTNAPIDHLSAMLLRVMNANFRMGTDPAPRRLASLATRKDLPSRIRAEAVHALGQWAQPPARDRLVGVYRPLPARDPAPARAALAEALPGLFESARQSEELMTATLDAAARLSLSNASPAIATVVRDTGASPAVRAAALRAFTRLESNRSAVSDLLASAAGDTSEPLRLAAFKLNAELNPQDALGQMAARLANGTLAEQQAAYTSLGELNSDAADALLADALDRLMRREIANEVALDLIEAAARRPTDAVKSRLAAYQDWKLPKDALSPYRETLHGGDAARGRRIFYENAAVACARCHQIGSDGGGNAGPKLDGLATRTTPEHWLESVVFPNQQVVQGFESALITLKDGQSYAGVVKSETDDTLILLAPEEGEIPLKKADIASREKGLSGMPEGLGQLLTRHELRDLIAFLGTLK